MGDDKLWKILKEMGIRDHLTCLLINLVAGQEEAVRTGHGTMEYYSVIKRDEYESVELAYMNVDPVIQSEVYQKQKNKYCILTHIDGI